MDALIQKIEGEMKKHQDGHASSQRLYDRSTLHGRNATAQQKFRETLSEQFESIEKSSRRVSR